MLDARLLDPDLADLADHLVGPVERRRRRELCDRNDVLFVLARNEAAGNRVEAEVRQGDEATVDDERDTRPSDDAGRGAEVAVACALEATVEAAEEAAKHLVHHARQAIFLGAM